MARKISTPALLALEAFERELDAIQIRFQAGRLDERHVAEERRARRLDPFVPVFAVHEVDIACAVRDPAQRRSVPWA